MPGLGARKLLSGAGTSRQLQEALPVTKHRRAGQGRGAESFSAFPPGRA